ncbi:Tetratricopeptide repeat-containing protein [Eubacterium ruminantium]|nr:Tetratricopeptide repeat-containing protein [Eubacterium ruminantium]
MEMLDIWAILGIEETADTDKLKKAYRIKLSENNPEDNPEGFKILRRAYEEALKKASETPAHSDNSTAMGEDKNEAVNVVLSEPESFAKKLESLYKDFYKRIDINAWKELLNTEYAVSLDTSSEALDVLIRFFMSHFYIPRYVYRLVTRQYFLNQRKKELEEKYPTEILDFISGNPIYPEMLDYRHFSGPEDADYDGYIRRFEDLENAIRTENKPEQEKIIEELLASPIKNPSLQISICKSLIQRGELQSALLTVQKLEEEHPDDISVLLCKGDVLLNHHENDEAIECYETVLKKDPDSMAAKVRIGEAQLYMGQPEKAKETFMELAKDRPYDNYIRALIQKCNDMIIENNLKKLGGDISEKEDHRIRLDTAWSYYQSYNSEDAVDILENFEPFSDEVIEYNNVKGRAYLILQQAAPARECFLIWKTELEKLSQDPQASENEKSTEIKKALKRMPYVNYLIGSTYFIQKDYKQAEEYIDTALRTEHDEIIVSKEMKCEILFEERRYSECLTACEKVLEEEDNFIARLYLAKTLFELGSYQRALNEAGRVKHIYPYNVSPYKLEMDIFIKVKQYRDAETVISSYSKLNPDSSLCKMMKAKILYLEEEKYDEAEALLRKINIDDKNSDIEKPEEYYTLLGDCLEEINDYQGAENAFKQAVLHDPDNRFIHRRLGMIYRKMLRFPEAIAAYSKQIEIDARDTDYLFRAITYKVLGDNQKADLDYAVVMQFTEPEGYVYTLAAENKLQMCKYKDAIMLFLKGYEHSEQALDKDRARHGLARGYMLCEEYDKAEEVLKQLCEDGVEKPKAIFAYAELLRFLGRLDEAENQVSKLLYSKYKVDDRVYNEICRYKCCAGDTAGAEKIYKKAGNEGVDTTEMAFDIGHHMLDNKEYAKAEKYLLQCSEEYDYISYSELAEAAAGQFGGKTRYKRYKDHFLRLNKDKSTPEVLVDKARLYRVEKDYDTAEKLLYEALHQPCCNKCSAARCHEAYKELCKLYLITKQKDKLGEALALARRYGGYDAWLEMIAVREGI